MNPRPGRAVHSLGINPLTYADPVGNEVVRRLEGDVQIIWPDGFRLWINKAHMPALVRFLTMFYRFQASRKGYIWGWPKEKSPVLGKQAGLAHQHIEGDTLK